MHVTRVRNFRPPGDAVTSVWSGRLYSMFDALTWIALLNLGMILFTLLGGVVLGWAPASVAASSLVRKRARGESFSFFPTFWRDYRAEFVRANLLLQPFALVLVALLFSWQFFAAGSDVLSAVIAPICLVVGAVVVIVGSVLVPLVNHYEVPGRTAVASAVTFTLANPLLLLANAAAVTGVLAVTWFLPGLVPLFTFGLLSYVTTRLALDFFVRNDQRLSAGTVGRQLPA